MDIRALGKFLVLVVFSLALASCTKVKFSYGFLDNWLRWQTYDYFDLNREQKSVLKQLTKDFHSWHRHNELEDYADFLSATQTTLNQPTIDDEDIELTLNQVQSLWLRSAEQLHTIAEELLPTLSAEQTEQIIGNVQQQLMEFQDEQVALQPQERVEQLTERMQKQVKKQVGGLTEQQQNLIKTWAAQQHDTSVYALHQQLLWLDDLRQILQSDLSAPANLARAKKLIFEQPDYINPQHAELAQGNNRRTGELITALHATLSDKQKHKLISRLARYERDFRDLAR